MSVEPDLQSCVYRFARALNVPARLIALHPREKGHPGNPAALAPAIAISSISAFEGFVENFMATALYRTGMNFAQIAHRANFTNPHLKDFEKAVKKNFAPAGHMGNNFSVDVWTRPRESGKTNLWSELSLTWEQAKAESAGWMEVRHCLSHGAASGWGSEVWPDPVGKNDYGYTASSVLKPGREGKHSLTLQGAISCARIYIWGAAYLANTVAEEFEEKLDWEVIPAFPLGPDS